MRPLLVHWNQASCEPCAAYDDHQHCCDNVALRVLMESHRLCWDTFIKDRSGNFRKYVVRELRSSQQTLTVRSLCSVAVL